MLNMTLYILKTYGISLLSVLNSKQPLPVTDNWVAKQQMVIPSHAWHEHTSLTVSPIIRITHHRFQ